MINDLKRRPIATIACCGIFHYRNTIVKLVSDGFVTRFIFSHKLSTFRDQAWAKNIWFKEYLIQLVTRGAGEAIQRRISPLIHDMWDIGAARQYHGGEILHVMLHGNCRRLITKAKAEGAIIIGEAVNTHPDNYHAVNVATHRACGINYSSEMPAQLKRLREEIRLCDYLIVPSGHVQRSFEATGFPRARIKCMPFGVRADFFNPPESTASRSRLPLQIVMVAQATPRKGLHVLFEIWKAAAFAPGAVTLKVIGVIPPTMRKFVSTAPAGIVFAGPVSRSQVAEELKSAAIFLLPTQEEGFAIAILEAMAAGCAVVTSTASGAEELVVNGQNGFLVEPEDVDGYVRALHRLLQDEQLRNMIGANARNAVRMHANWNAYCSGLGDYYNDVMAQHRQPGELRASRMIP